MSYAHQEANDLKIGDPGKSQQAFQGQSNVRHGDGAMGSQQSYLGSTALAQAEGRQPLQRGPETTNSAADLNKFQSTFEQNSVVNNNQRTDKIFLSYTDQPTFEAVNVRAANQTEAASATHEM